VCQPRTNGTFERDKAGFLIKYDDDDDSPHPVTRISAGHTPG